MSQSYDIGDLVRIRCRFGIHPTGLAIAAAAGASSITVRDGTGYIPAQTVMLSYGTDTEESGAISTVVGRVITLTGPLLYAHSAGAAVIGLADPTTVTLELREPDADLVLYDFGNAEIIRQDVGRYYRDVSITSDGTWHYRWVGTGAVETAEEGRLYVREKLVT